LPVAIIYVAWEFVYFAYSWGASGKTLGMALLGVQVVAADGSEAGPRRAVLRTLAFPLSFLLFGLGFTGILLQRDRRALHDLIAETAVVYAWDARAARLRYLDRASPDRASPDRAAPAELA
ncbi:MAG: RDD family protein, partial [Streptosporangiaceae bacterium]